jgi:hypothetical protein
MKIGTVAAATPQCIGTEMRLCANIRAFGDWFGIVFGEADPPFVNARWNALSSTRW